MVFPQCPELKLRTNHNCYIRRICECAFEALASIKQLQSFQYIAESETVILAPFRSFGCPDVTMDNRRVLTLDTHSIYMYIIELMDMDHF